MKRKLIDLTHEYYVRFILSLVLGFIAANLIVGGANYLVLHRAGEGLSLDKGIELQYQRQGLYSSAFDEIVMTPAANLKRYELYKPAVIALGTSRVLQFRPNSFKQSFVNLGMHFTLDRGVEFAEFIVSKHKPDLVILGVDWWWFNKAFPFPEIGGPAEDLKRTLTHYPRSLAGFAEYRSTVLLRPTKWLFEWKLSPANYASMLFGLTTQTGLPAITRQEGKGPRGSMYYGRLSKHREDWKFKNTLGRVKAARAQFRQGMAVDEGRWRSYLDMVAVFETAGVVVVPFMPPLASKVLDAMWRRGGYGIFARLREHLVLRHDIVFDFTDPSLFGSPDCEFLDGFHGGEVTYPRMLQEMSRRHKSVRDAVDGDAISSRIAKYAVRATAYDTVPGGGNIHERDFLGLGCPKES